MDSLKRLLNAYEKWVAANPDTVTDLETTTKWVSYFIAGRISDSTVVSELIYSLSNLLMLYNDRIISEANPNSPPSAAPLDHQTTNTAGAASRLRMLLTTLEYCEVFIEISAKRLLGAAGKWILIAALQLAKAAARFFILRQSTTEIITSPALPALNRRAVVKQQKAASNGGVEEIAANSIAAAVESQHSITFKLKRSGRVVRKVEGAPPLAYRDFKPPQDEKDLQLGRRIPPALLRAEYVYIAKPLIHLATMGVFGAERWHQYAVALACDLYSINVYYQHRDAMSAKQKLEMSRRCINLLLYLMRTPFYERHTQRRLERVLGFIATHVPFVKMVAGPLQEYIPHWQSTYFYLWST